MPVPVITAPHCIEELFELTGRRMRDYVELLPVAPFYRLHWIADGTSFDYDGNTDRMIEQIRALRAEDVDGYANSPRTRTRCSMPAIASSRTPFRVSRT